MQKSVNKGLWRYVGRFSLIHIITYSVIAIMFLHVQEMLPTVNRVALEFYKPYRSLGFLVLFAEGLRGAVLALVLYPFYDRIVKGNHGGLVLFGALWGLAILGSLEPLPGSIEGLIYTETTLVEHFMVLIAGAIQVMLFSWLFLRWEYRFKTEVSAND